MKVLAKLGRKPLNISSETQMLRYLQRLAFLHTDTFLYQALRWINHGKKYVKPRAFHCWNPDIGFRNFF